MKTLYDIAAEVGFEEIDQEISVWIESGEFDEDVQERALKLGYVKTENVPVVESKVNSMQRWHRAHHKSGPYGWEFCGHAECQ